MFVGQDSAADAIDEPVVELLALFVKALEEHAVGVKILEDLRFPNDFGRSLCFQDGKDSCIREVSFARGSKAAV